MVMKDLMPLDISFDDEMRDEMDAKIERPKFPPGLTLHLDDKTIEMLGLKKLPDPGADIPLHAMAEVVEVRKEDDDKMSMTLQIKAMAIKPTKTDIEEEVDKFYGA
jgi:hypothetical protein